MSLQLGIPLTLIAAILQATVLPRLRVFGGQPDLVVIIVLAWSLLDQDREGMAWAFVGGLWLDLFSGSPMGMSSLILVPIAYLVGLTEARIYRTNVALPLALAGSGALGYHVLYVLALRFLADSPLSWAEIFFYVTLPSLFFDLVLIYPVTQILGRWHARLHPRQVKL